MKVWLLSIFPRATMPWPSLKRSGRMPSYFTSILWAPSVTVNVVVRPCLLTLPWSTRPPRRNGLSPVMTKLFSLMSDGE